MLLSEPYPAGTGRTGMLVSVAQAMLRREGDERRQRYLQSAPGYALSSVLMASYTVRLLQLYHTNF